ncbi:MAG: DUF4062 domain-containing protein [Candidatus Magnetominusculus sp. LBB02]|nr:DUF4062 domain-containing protein [Candidatus Magnetominusculus sp. LBB02]
MANPRIFISSTCYDLQEIRNQLRQFIEDMGYEPVMSDFGDIFYDFEKHVHDSCKEEISKSNIFILIVGNNYGSLYYKHGDKEAVPDSVTLQEFRKALEIGIPKHIFINRDVERDYLNYKRAFLKNLQTYFEDNVIEEADVEKTTTLIKKRFDTTYPFPVYAYKYVFYFLDIIHELVINNVKFPFEFFDDIKKTLRKQWAGFFYDALTKQRSIAVEKVDELGKRLDKIEQHLRTLAESSTTSQSRSNLTIDMQRFSEEINMADMEQLKERIDDILSSILYYHEEDEWEIRHHRFVLNETFDLHMTATWLFSLGGLIQNYKWSTYIPIEELFKGYGYWDVQGTVSYKTIFELFSIYEGLSENNRASFLNTVKLRLNELYVPEPDAATESDLEPF